MPITRVLIAFCLCASISTAADLRLLSGKTITGELVGINGKEIVIKTSTGDVPTPLAQVLQLDLEPVAPAPKKEVKVTDVELIDGSLLHCSSFVLKGKQAELTLLSGQAVKLPLEAIRYVLNDAEDEKNRKDWKERFVEEKRTSDLVAIRSAEGRSSRLKGTFGEADDEGKTIQFDLNSGGNPRPLKLERVQGMLFLRQGSTLADVLCKVHDIHQGLLMVAEVKMDDKGCTISTAAGVKIEYPLKLVSRFDFSRGKLTFLSDLEPVKVVETSTEERIEHYRRDKNLEDQKIHLRVPKDKGESEEKEFDKGLALHSRTELEYDLKGEYNEFKALLGVDPKVGGTDGSTLVKLEADGKEIYSGTITRQDLAIAINRDIKGVSRLRILVSSGDLLDLGKHVNLALARVSK